MTESNGYQHGVPCWVETWQNDPDSATSFYSHIFGWETENTLPPDADGTFHMCRLAGRDVAGIGSPIPEGAPPVPTWTTFIQVDSATEAAKKVEDAGGKMIVEPFESLEGGRLTIAADPSGAAFAAWEPAKHKGAEVVNEPGAWAMSRLSTDDTEGAKRFYGQVFGWESETFGLDNAEMTLWKVPGYVGGRPEQPVSREVVATMGPPGENGEEPPGWEVDFWIADVDAAVAKTAEDGGRILAGPYDIPGVGMRRAEIVDPQGARLALTRPPGLD
jgi:predicted enzyme related to lactoylglutathione lyase